MADSTWISVDGNLNAAGSYSPSGVPGAGGNIIFNQTSHVDVSTNLTALSAVDLGAVWVKPEYEGNIGADGNPLTAGIEKLSHRGQGGIWLAPQTHASGTWIVVDSPNEQDALTITGGDQFDMLACINGGVYVKNNTIIGEMLVGSRNSAHMPRVTIEGGASFDVVVYAQRSGYVTTKKTLGTVSCVIDGGLLVFDATASDTWDNTINITGGTFVYNGTGVISAVYVTSGILDLSQDSRAKTINYLVLFPGSTYLSNDNTTIGVLVDLRGPVPIIE